MKIKFLKKGLKVDDKYYPCWYSSSGTMEKNNPKKWVTIYLKTYDRLPEELYNELQVENNTEIQTDYIERDRIRIPKTSKYFDLIESLAI